MGPTVPSSSVTLKRVGRAGRPPHLSGELDALPQTQVDEDPGQQQDQRQVPLERALVVDPVRLLQNLVSENQKRIEERCRCGSRVV